MTFRVALTAAAVIAVFGAAHAQTLRSDSLVDRVTVDIGGKPMPVIRAELARAAEAVCRSASPFAERDEVCVSATYGAALRRVKQARIERAPVLAPTQVASR